MKTTLNLSSRPKGRVLNETALLEVRSVLEGFPRDKSLLIEALHLLQDHFGHLSKDNLHALSHELRLSMAEVYEVASFYAHFIIEGDPVDVRVCVSLTCAMAGSAEMIAALTMQGRRVTEVPCLGRCNEAPVSHEGAFLAPPVNEFKVNLPHYEALKNGFITAEYILDKIKSLRGLGGAGFPTARKWEIVRGAAGEKVMVVNADEGEPGTFKDKLILENHVNEFLDGMMVASHIIGASQIYIYLRDEYPHAREILKAANLPNVHLRRGAGAYICGEESALIESIEGKRGLPRLRPPYVGERGVFGKPTLVNNVETLYMVSEILSGRDASERHYSVSGRVKNPGVYRMEGGVTASQLLAKAGGMEEEHEFKAYLPGGASGGILPAMLADEPLDFGTLTQHGAFVGSHAVIFLSQKDDLKGVAKNLLEFFKHESCGQCTPCREGTAQLIHLIDDETRVKALSTVMMEASICGLGQAAPNPVLSLYRHFKGEF
jgi:formate dehydrogenase beta subunit